MGVGRALKPEKVVLPGLTLVNSEVVFCTRATVEHRLFLPEGLRYR